MTDCLVFVPCEETATEIRCSGASRTSGTIRTLLGGTGRVLERERERERERGVNLKNRASVGQKATKIS